MRKLITSDAFKMMQIIKVAGVKRELESILNESIGKSENNEVQAMGIKLFLTVMDGCGTVGVEERFYSLLGGIIGKTAKEVESTELSETMANVAEIVKNNNIMLFFKQASQLT